jgi:hypothetical protein
MVVHPTLSADVVLAVAPVPALLEEVPLEEVPLAAVLLEELTPHAAIAQAATSPLAATRAGENLLAI